MNEINKLKKYLTRSGILYISDEIIDNIIYLHFTYEHDNFTISINNKYKLLLLNKEHSFYEETGLYTTDLFSKDDLTLEFDSMEELSFILKDYIPNSEFKDYSLTTIDCVANSFLGYTNQFIYISTINNDKKIINFENYTSKLECPKSDIELIEYIDGLNTFEQSIFQKNWLENFNKKVKNYEEKDLYIIISTLIGYTYKFMNNMWEDEKIDPYVIENATSLAIRESKKFDDDFLNWYTKWNNNLTNEKIKQYIKGKK